VSYDEFYKTDPKLEAEFQTPTIFDRDFNFHRSIFYRAPKIVKIIIYILYICKSVSTNFNLSNFNLWVCLYGISFQSYKISIYIQNTRRF
jgi:hypothetical protein